MSEFIPLLFECMIADEPALDLHMVSPSREGTTYCGKVGIPAPTSVTRLEIDCAQCCRFYCDYLFNKPCVQR